MSVGLSGPWFYVDPRISQPGEYEIWLALYDDDFQCEGCVPGVVPEPRLVTTPARLVVRTPSGADASIWKLMQEQTCESGFWTPGCLTQARSVIDVIVRDHRDSGYFPYAAALKRVHEREARIAMLEDVIARHPTTVLRGFLEWRLSIDYYSAANDAELRQNDHAAAARLRTIHSRYLRSALTGTLPPDVRKKATEQLEGESRPTE